MPTRVLVMSSAVMAGTSVGGQGREALRRRALARIAAHISGEWLRREGSGAAFRSAVVSQGVRQSGSDGPKRTFFTHTSARDAHCIVDSVAVGRAPGGCSLAGVWRCSLFGAESTVSPSWRARKGKFGTGDFTGAGNFCFTVRFRVTTVGPVIVGTEGLCRLNTSRISRCDGSWPSTGSPGKVSRRP